MGRFGGNRHGRDCLKKKKEMSDIIVFQLL